MKDLHKDDIDRLNLIIKLAIETGKADMNNLPEYSIGEDEALINFLGKYYYMYNYKRLFLIIHECDFAEVSTGRGSDFAGYYVKPYIPETKRFLDDGGFTKLFEEQELKKAAELVKNKKVIIDFKLSKWQLWLFWLFAFFSFTAFSKTVYDIFCP